MRARKRAWPASFDRYFKERGEKPAPSNQSVRRKASRGSDKSSSAGTLAPYAGAFDTGMGQHLQRRIGFGASADRVQELDGLTVDAAISQIVADAVARPMPEPPHWVDAGLPPDGSSDAVYQAYFDNNVEWGFTYSQEWILSLYEGGLRERMTLFWSNHFVTEMDVYFFAPMMYRYLTLLRTHALGNFKQMVYDIGIDPAMLNYLNGEISYWWAPNENYARELLELFTMGQFDKFGNANYTQDDITELARALTGWGVNYFTFESSFDRGLHDFLRKSIFGVEGSFDYDRVIDLIFEERSEQIAYFVCSKMYAAFVHDEPDDNIVQGLADIFLANDFEIAPVMEALLKSEHFYAGDFRGAKIKSPVDMMVGLMHETGVARFKDDAHEVMYWMLRDMGQQLLQPPNVAGWPGYRDWISTATLPNRWDSSHYLYISVFTGNYITLVPLAQKLVDENDPLLAFKLPEALASHFLAVPPDQLGFEASNQDFAGDLVTYPLPQEILDAPQHVRDMAKIFLQGNPWYEWDLHHPAVLFTLLDYLRFLTELPEYQLT